jgi:hypothetical protein
VSLPPTSGGHHDLLVEWPITGIGDWPALTGDVGWKPVQGDARCLPAGVSRWLPTHCCPVGLDFCRAAAKDSVTQIAEISTNRPERAATCQPRASIREFHERLRRPGLRIESSHKALKGRHKCQTGWPGVTRRDHQCRTWLESHVEPRNEPWNVANSRRTRNRTAPTQPNERHTWELRNQRATPVTPFQVYWESIDR